MHTALGMLGSSNGSLHFEGGSLQKILGALKSWSFPKPKKFKPGLVPMRSVTRWLYLLIVVK